jgi:hypothetical protein
MLNAAVARAKRKSFGSLEMHCFYMLESLSFLQELCHIRPGPGLKHIRQHGTRITYRQDATNAHRARIEGHD